MFKVVILGSNNATYSSIMGPMDMFLQAGVFWNGIMGEDITPQFSVTLVSLDGKALKNHSGVTVTPHCSMHNIEKADIVIIPSEGFNFEVEDKDFQQRVEWVRKMYDKGAMVASSCTGAFLLAETGLLNNKSATTHWGLSKMFKNNYPNVELREDLIVVDEGRVFTAGGVTADLNLSIYIINKLCGREVAMQTSRCTLVDLNKTHQSPHISFILEKNHGDVDILESQNYIEKNFQKNLSIPFLSKKLSMSERNYNRRFKEATSETAINYIQKLRVEKAKKLLESRRISFDEISYKVGYENTSYFRKLFKKTTGLSPNEYKKKFSKYI